MKTLLKNEKSFLCLETKFYILIQRCNGRVLMGMHWGEVHVSVRALIVLVRFQDITSNCSSGEIGIHAGL